MRKLFLLRHAKSENNNIAGDKARELTDKGLVQARLVGESLQNAGIQLVLCSSATRTKQTFKALNIEQLASFQRVEYQDALYNCGVDTLKMKIGEVEDEVSVLLVIAHAPAIPSYAAELTWTQDHRLADNLQCNFPTAALVEFDVDGTWVQLADGHAKARLVTK